MAGLTVLVYEAVRSYGVHALGVLVLRAGLVQLGLGALRLGRWFRVVSVAVVQGVLAEIGLVLIAGQVYAMGDAPAPASGVGKIAGLAPLVGDADPVALAIGGATVVVLLLWPRWRRGARWCPRRCWRWGSRRWRPGCSSCPCGGSRCAGCWMPYGRLGWRIWGGSRKSA